MAPQNVLAIPRRVRVCGGRGCLPARLPPPPEATWGPLGSASAAGSPVEELGWRGSGHGVSAAELGRHPAAPLRRGAGTFRCRLEACFLFAPPPPHTAHLRGVVGVLGWVLLAGCSASRRQSFSGSGSPRGPLQREAPGLFIFLAKLIRFFQKSGG